MKQLLMALVVATGASALFGESYDYNDGERVWSLERSTCWVSEEPIRYYSVTDVRPKPEGKLEIPYRLGDFNIIGIGSGAFADASNLTEVVVGDGIKEIACGAFRNCERLSDITLPSGMDRISGDAFVGTRAEEKNAEKGFQIGEYFIKYTGDKSRFSIPGDVKMICDYAFSHYATNSVGEYTLTEVSIPEGVETIGECAFFPQDDDCALEKIELPDSVTTVRDSAFADCWNLKTLKLGSGITRIYDINDWFDWEGNNVEKLILGNGVVEIPSETFCGTGWNCLNTVEFGEALTCIGASAFEGCEALSNVNFRAAVNLSGMGSGAFAYSAVTRVDLSACTQLLELPTCAFAWCWNLEKVVFNEGLKTIASGAFCDCDLLEKVEFPESLREIGGAYWDPCCDVYGAFEDCDMLRTIVLNEGLETIGEGAFRGYNAIDRLEFPASLASIGAEAFSDCTNVTKVTFASDAVLKQLGYQAFAGLVKLDRIEIPASVETIDGYLFDGCEMLEKVTGGEGVTACFETMFGDCPFAWFGEFDPDGEEQRSEIVTFGKVVIGLRGKCPKRIGADDFGKEIVQIAPDVFSWWNNSSVTNLTEVAFPETLEVIGSYAFNGAMSLKEVDFGENAENLVIGDCAFRQTGLRELEGAFRTVGERAFAECFDLKDVKLTVQSLKVDDETEPDGWYVTGGTVGWQAFAGCTNLVSADVAALGVDEDWDCESYTAGGNLGSECFAGCEKLKNVRIVCGSFWGDSSPFGDYYISGYMPNGEWFDYSASSAALEEIELDAPEVPSMFAAYQSELEKVTLGERIRYIGESAFEGCEKLREIALPPDLHEIKKSAFEGCAELREIAIPEKTACIGESAFRDCTGLRTVRGCEAVEFVDPFAFENTDFINSARRGPLQVGCVLFRWVDSKEGETAEIDSSVKTIACNAFTSNEVAKVIVPEGVKWMPDGVFRDCPQLQVVEFKNPDVGLGVGAAVNCPNVTWIASKAGFVFRGFSDGCGWCDDYRRAQFEKVRFHNDPNEDGAFVAGSTYVGWIMRGDAVVGTLTVKTAKPDANGQSKVTATVQLPGSKKAYTGLFEVDPETGKARSADSRYSELCGMILGGRWLSGTVNFAGANYTVRGGSDVSNTEAFDLYAGHVWAAALEREDEGWEEDYYTALCNGYSSIVVAPAKKGKVKVTGLLADGTKISTTAQMVAGDHGMVAAPVTLQLYQGKKGGFSFLLQFYMDNGKPKMCFDGGSADGSIGVWRYQLPDHWKPFASVDVWVRAVGEIDVNGVGFKTEKMRLYGYGDDCFETALRYATKGKLVGAKRYGTCCDSGCVDGFGVNFVDVVIDAVKGKWTLPKAGKLSLLTKPEAYAEFIADRKNWYWCCDSDAGGFAPDGMYLAPYWWSDSSQKESCCEWVGEPGSTCCGQEPRTPTHWLVYDLGAKLDKKTGTLSKGENTNEGAWKLSYAKKTGQFSGSMQYYWVDTSKADKHVLKKGKATVGGVVIDGEAYGTAVVKGVASTQVGSGNYD